MRLNTLPVALVLTAAALAAFVAAGSYATIVPVETKRNTVLIADGPGPELPPPIVIWWPWLFAAADRDVACPTSIREV